MSERHPHPKGIAFNERTDPAQHVRGRLKVFLGYAPGVGKTYAMLQAALQKDEEGVDVVAAFVKTHGRAESEALLAGLGKVADRQVVFRGLLQPEMDLDAVLARRPALALVDDLAHINTPGSRHARRYQDVLELLDAGIDVYTTLNVQHLASLGDIVTQITGVVVRETIPDRVLDEADEIELVDLPIDELLQRFAEGKVAIPERTAREARLFFRPGNLSALRELAFRRAADRVDEQMRAYMQTHGIIGPWPATERVLVCIGPSPLAERLVRAGRRLAARLNAEWFAVYVETPAHATLSEEERDRLARMLRLAEELGARSLTLPGRSIAEAVSTFARSRNVTKIMVGKPLHSHWRDLIRGSVVDQIIRDSQDIDVYVISGKPLTLDTAADYASPSRELPWPGFLASTGLVLLATIAGLPLRPVIEPTNLVMLYLLAVIVAALRLGRAPAVLASVLSVVAFDLVFVPPYYTFIVSDAQYLLTFGALLIVGLLTSTLTTRAKEQARAGRRRQAHTLVLYELSRDLAGAADLQVVAQVVVRHVEETLDSRAIILARQNDGLERLHASAGLTMTAEEHDVAAWTFAHRAPAGKGTETLAEAPALYLPLVTAKDVIGVLGLYESNDKESEALSSERRRLLESIASQAAVAVERALLAEEARRVQLLHETEKLQSALLNAISHDLRTPLASITGALSSLRDDSGLLTPEARQDLLQTAFDEAERLNRLVANLLKTTQLEAGALRLSPEPYDIEDVIGVALAQLEHRLQGRDVRVEIPDDRPLAHIDASLMTLVFVNLLENAHKYSPSGTPLRVLVEVMPDYLKVQVLDRGPGIPDAESERIFDKFYRLPDRDKVVGTGLGLSISRGIVEAHGGRIWVENRQGGGSVFTVTLPLAQILQQQPTTLTEVTP